MLQSQVFVPVPLLPDLPPEASGKTLYVEVTAPQQKANTSSEEAAGFKFSKALKGIKSEEGSAYNSRGDGTIDGKLVHKQGNFVHLAPDALKPENADDTLKELDRISGFAKRPLEGTTASSSSRAAAPAADAAAMASLLSAPAHAPARLAASASMYEGVREAAAGVLYDVGDDDGKGGGNSRTAAPGAPTTPPGLLNQLEEPRHELLDLPADAAGPARLQLTLQLPKISSAAEAQLDVGRQAIRVFVPSVYRALVTLPCSVRDEESSAKWVKAKKVLVITVPKA
mmetsp:Transcript_14091/g.30552  ORF Transcript_14091/g.30552 Transcript_14091/m.30552 type:complete len:284 (-) Transcript_14091:347-1198(-)